MLKEQLKDPEKIFDNSRKATKKSLTILSNQTIPVIQNLKVSQTY